MQPHRVHSKARVASPGSALPGVEATNGLGLAVSIISAISGAHGGDAVAGLPVLGGLTAAGLSALGGLTAPCGLTGGGESAINNTPGSLRMSSLFPECKNSLDLMWALWGWGRHGGSTSVRFLGPESLSNRPSQFIIG